MSDLISRLFNVKNDNMKKNFLGGEQKDTQEQQKTTQEEQQKDTKDNEKDAVKNT